MPIQPSIIIQLREWHARYPIPGSTNRLNASARRTEDEWLGRFAGVPALSRAQVRDLVDWKFNSMPHRRKLARTALDEAHWPHTREVIKAALGAEDDLTALSCITGPDGVFRFGPAMGSTILAACRPERYTVADTRALKALRALSLMEDGPPEFRIRDWAPYLARCRSLSEACRASLRYVDRALWVGGGTV